MERAAEDAGEAGASAGEEREICKRVDGPDFNN